jgi:putative oxidoreductase
LKTLKNFFAVNKDTMAMDFAILGIRLFVGYAFIIHGWGKIQNPMSWMGPESPVWGVFQLMAALSEFGGGIALILGLLSRLGALGLTITMSVAASFHLFGQGDPLIATGPGGSAEPAVNYLLIGILLLIHGPGRHSLDKVIFGAAK